MKEIAIKIIRAILLILIIVLYLFVSVTDLDRDVINPDGINWHNRTAKFVEAINQKEYYKAYQVYHPGITLMWISGPVLNSLYNNTADLNLSSEEQKVDFFQRHFYAKLSLVIFSGLVFIFTFLILWKMSGFSYALFFSLLFTLEPFVLGNRRLYHLDYLMTILVFLSFILVVYFSYKSEKWYLLPVSGMFFALALLTKSSAVVFLAAYPFILLLGNPVFYKKLAAIILFSISLVFFTYVFFPPLWKNPVKNFPKYYERIVYGVSEIGLEGKKEIGDSGMDYNITLDETLKDREKNFYISSLFMRLSPAGSILLIISVASFIYVMLRGFFSILFNAVKNRKILFNYEFSAASWISFWSLGLSGAVLIGLTLAVKKSDRYEILVFPFLLSLISWLLSRLNRYIAVSLIFLYVLLTGYELFINHPYYMAYSNPVLGGVELRLRALDDSPFGIGVVEAMQKVKADMQENDYDGYYTISGPKSIKAISVGGRYSRYPNCATDYVVVYALERDPIDICVNKYVLIDTVKIGGFDYWKIFKRLNQKHESY